MTEPSECGAKLHGEERARRIVDGFDISERVYSPGMKIHRHDHERASLSILLAGGYAESFGRRNRRCEPGTVIVHPEGEHHAEVHDPVPVKLLTIEVEERHLRDLGPSAHAFREAWHRTDYSISTFAYRLRFEIGRTDGASALVMESAILEILAALDSVRLAETNSAAWLRLVRDYLDANFRQPPTMRQLSILAGVHPVHVARAFRRRFGCSVGAYVRRSQVGSAAIMLEDKQNSLSNVAYDAGFADQSHMTRMVRAQTGLTPGAWRRREDNREA